MIRGGSSARPSLMDDQRPGRVGSKEERRKPLQDVDSTARARLLHALVWLVPVSLIFFAAVTYASLEAGASLLVALLIGIALGLAGPFLAYGLIAYLVMGGAVFVLGRLYGGGTAGTPLPPSYWRAQALSARGSHLEALKALEGEVARDRDDPGPCLRAAALCAGELGDLESAVGWYKRARTASRIRPETDAYALMRLADLYEAIGDEGRAMVELRCLLERHPGSQYAGAARTRLANLKRTRIETSEPDPTG